VRPSFKQCMGDALRPVMDKHLGQPVQSVRLRLSTRGSFGDAELRPHKAFGKMFIRMAIVFPVGAVATVLCFSVIGLPLGIPLFMWIGSWCSKPVMKHPLYNTDTSRSARGNSPTVESYEQAYDEFEGREWK
jgi:hypothetical protein